MRFLGLDLAGARNQKTALASLEYYPREKKVFLLDVYERIGQRENQTTDSALIETIIELKDPHDFKTVLGVNVPLTLPPCIECTKKHCPTAPKCSVPAVRWMKNHSLDRPLTPYTQRPFEIWVRNYLQNQFAKDFWFDVDEAMGGSKAPLTARLHYLKRHLETAVEIVEVWPKLMVTSLSGELEIPKRTFLDYRQLESGPHARFEILEAVCDYYSIFVYDRDLKKLSQSLPAFDAFFCALGGLLKTIHQIEQPPKGFLDSFGWVAFPSLEDGN